MLTFFGNYMTNRNNENFIKNIKQSKAPRWKPCLSLLNEPMANRLEQINNLPSVHDVRYISCQYELGALLSEQELEQVINNSSKISRAAIVNYLDEKLDKSYSELLEYALQQLQLAPSADAVEKLKYSICRLFNLNGCYESGKMNNLSLSQAVRQIEDKKFELTA